MLDYIASILIKLVSLVFRILPMNFVLACGRQCGKALFYLNSDRRAIAYANLRAAFCKEKTPAELRRLTKKVYMNLAETFFEIIALTKFNMKYFNKYIHVIGAENIGKAAEGGRGVIFLAAHYGNWELAGMIGAALGYPLTLLVREQSMKRVNELLNRLRESKGSKVVRKGMTTKNIIKTVREGGTVAILGDQNAGRTGVMLDFFGRLASTAPGALKIAAKTGASILPSFVTRTKGACHTAVIMEPFKIAEDEDITPHLIRYNKLLEENVRAHPEQYLWLHRKWKMCPVKKVLIITDGKTGHVNQALGVYREFKKYREKQDGHLPENTTVETKEVKFKNAFTKTLLGISSIFLTSYSQGCMKRLEACLTKDSYEALMREYYDVVISCGSSVTAVNRFLSLENNAKSACVMKPSFLGVNKFNIVVMPRHDAEPRRFPKHVIVMDTVPNTVDKESLEEASEEIRKKIKLENRPRVGVFFGGDNSDFALTHDTTRKVLKNLIDASEELDAEMLFTTSRRTSKPAERLVKEMLVGEKRCKFLVVANEKNDPHAACGILGLSDVVVVSGESVSMVSEAINSGKKVVVFRLEKKASKPSKFDKMLERLGEKGYVTVTEPEGLSETICNAFKAPKKDPVAEDESDRRDWLYRNMWRLI